MQPRQHPVPRGAGGLDETDPAVIAGRGWDRGPARVQRAARRQDAAHPVGGGTAIGSAGTSLSRLRRTVLRNSPSLLPCSLSARLPAQLRKRPEHLRSVVQPGPCRPQDLQQFGEEARQIGPFDALPGLERRRGMSEPSGRGCNPPGPRASPRTAAVPHRASAPASFCSPPLTGRRSACRRQRSWTGTSTKGNSRRQQRFQLKRRGYDSGRSRSEKRNCRRPDGSGAVCGPPRAVPAEQRSPATTDRWPSPGLDAATVPRP
jgi:hypothetical protein